MVEWVISVLDKMLGPGAWRQKSAPAVASSAFLLSVIGLALAGGGGAALVAAADDTARWVAGAVLAMGLLVLWSVFAGVRAFHRAKSEQP
jgi:hypothetical protein